MKSTAIAYEPLLTLSDIYHYLNVSITTLHRLVISGSLPPAWFTHKGTNYWKLSDIDKWLTS
ncbi:helix-turn-helix domain-containing protein [Shewanella sp. KX20019]|uniref:helix-turn-helix transcriptional regulator n=1 Tax=Shewanella sp. KX20019 TaxID=2803864 RepID=UPI0019281DC8|nr:helix-turn-helix domain-containing protein [Shewanella sp. KX20019]